MQLFFVDDNIAPVAVDDDAYTVENASIEIDVCLNDFDVDGVLDLSSVYVQRG